jgi:hypothetical protein
MEINIIFKRTEETTYDLIHEEDDDDGDDEAMKTYGGVKV